MTNSSVASQTKPYPAICLPDNSGCDFYQCRENIGNCGNQGYYLGYGFHNCRKFTRAREHMSPLGRAWIHQVRYCLQNQLAKLSENANCKASYDFAMETHVDCYFSTNSFDISFCDLGDKDKKLVYRIVGKQVKYRPLFWMLKLKHCR